MKLRQVAVHLTGAILAIARKSLPAGTAVRPRSVVTISIAVALVRLLEALVYIWNRNTA